MSKNRILSNIDLKNKSIKSPKGIPTLNEKANFVINGIEKIKSLYCSRLRTC